MLAMNISSVSIRYGSPAQALRITVCIIPCAASGYAHENAWSMRRGLPSASTTRSSGPCTNPSGPASSAPLSLRVLPGPVRRRQRLGIRRLVTERARRIDRAQQHLQHVQRAAGMEAVAVRADPAHRVHRHRAARPSRCARGPSCRSMRSAVDSLLSNAAAASSRAMRRMVSAGMPQRSLTASGEYCGSR